jgi:diaminopimelate epimerase
VRLIHADAHGNDFLLVDAADVPDGADYGAMALRLCHRRSGVGAGPRRGADGLIVFAATANGASMQLRNADGSYSEVSGNGVRCLGAYLADQRRVAIGDVIQIDTDAGPKQLTLLARDGRRGQFRSSMGAPAAIRRLVLDVSGTPINVATLNVGNPQCVVLDRGDDAALQAFGAAIATHPHFPDGTNVEFLRVDRTGPAAPNRLSILIWERGVGPTASSGTGTCAAAVAAACFAGAARDVEVTAPGGPQRVEWLDDGLWLTGWAELVAEYDASA